MESGQQSIHKYLINRSQTGDRQAQSELYKLYVKAMYNISRRMMGNEEDAKDVLQDSFIHAFTKLNTLKDEGMFTAWLKRIVVNHCLNALKKRQKMDMNLEAYTPEEDRTNQEIHSFKIQQVLQALDHISAGCRTVLNLYVFEGYDHAEIAKILKISESASKAQYSKAKSKIRDLLQTNAS